MKICKATLFVCLATLILSGVAFGQETPGKGTRATDDDRDKAENSTAAFDPSDIYADETRHVVVYFDIDGGVLVPSSRPAQLVRGGLPYKPPTGDLRVVAKDKNGKVVASYTTSDIRFIRVFEGRDRELTRIREAKDLMVRIQYDPRITQLTLGSPTRKDDQKTFDVSSAVAGLFGKE